MTARIRPAGPADHATLLPLYLAFFREDAIATPPEAVAMNLALMLQDPRARLLLAEEDGTPMGLAAGSLTFGVEFGCAAELEDLYVIPAARGRGLARQLAQAVIDWAEEAGAGEVILVITPEAEARQGLTTFYARLGFRDARRITLYRSPAPQG